MSEVYFTSDTHFGHAYVAQLRGFATAEEHDEHIVTEWNRRVTKRDTVWLLGDVTLAPITRIGPLLARLKGAVHLVAGNHDRCHPVFKGAHRQQRTYLEHFETVSLFARTRVGSTDVLLSHFPYQGEGQRDQADRHVPYRLRNAGVPLIHGHTHDPSQRRTPADAETPMVHVGWDAWRHPVHSDEIAHLL